MQQTAKTSSFTKIIALVAVFGLISYAFGKGIGRPARTDKEEQITIEVQFDPTIRPARMIHVIVYVETEIYNEWPEKSPWIKTEWIPKGARVVFNGWQHSPGKLTCIIRSSGKEVARNETKNQDELIVCLYKRVM